MYLCVYLLLKQKQNKVFLSSSASNSEMSCLSLMSAGIISMNTTSSHRVLRHLQVDTLVSGSDNRDTSKCPTPELP